MTYAFQDRDTVFLVMDFLSGGDLRYHLIHRKTFTENETSIHSLLSVEFFIACILVGLEYIHSNEILHRDIKPENLIFDSDGNPNPLIIQVI
jgi:serine/threonine protein kinase